MPHSIRQYTTLAIIALAVILIATYVLMARPLARQMEPYRQTPPADTTINVPTDGR